jgi:predicted DNA-binding transcriptional regulator AlpA
MPDGGARPAWTPRALQEREAAYYVGLSTTTFRQAVVPACPAIRLTTGRVAWLREDLDAWLDARRGKPVDQPAPPGEASAPEGTRHVDFIAAGLANLPPRRGARRPRPAG